MDHDQVDPERAQSRSPARHAPFLVPLGMAEDRALPFFLSDLLLLIFVVFSHRSLALTAQAAICFHDSDALALAQERVQIV